MAESFSVEAFLRANVGDYVSGFKEAEQASSGLEKQTGKTGITIGKLAAAVGITALVSKGFNMVKNSVSAAFGRIDTMERFERVMTTITGSTEEANKALDSARNVVKGTAYGLDTAAKSVQDFVTRGVSVDKATARLEAWGDAVAFYGEGSNEQLANVMDALSKMTTSGKVGMDQMDRLFDAGIDAVGMYATAVGRDAESVQKDLSSGKISAEDFIDTVTSAMMEGTNGVQKIAGAAKEAGASWAGSFDNMKAAVTRGVVGIVSGIDTMLSSNGLPSMRDMISQVGVIAENVLNKVAASLPGIMKTIMAVYNVLKPFLPLILAVGTAAAGMATAFATFNSIKKTITSIKTSAKALNAVMAANPWLLVIGAIIAAAILIYVYWEPISEFFKKLWDAIKSAGLEIWAALSETWNNAVQSLRDAWGEIVGFFQGIWTAIQTAGQVAWAAMQAAWVEIVNSFKNLWSGITGFFSALWSGVVSVALAIIQPFVNGVMNIYDNMSGGIQKIFDGLKAYFTAVWNIIKTIFLGAVLLIIDLVTGDFTALRKDSEKIFDNLKKYFGQLWDAVKTIFKGALDAIIGFGKGAWQNFQSTTTTVFTAVKTFLTNLWTGIKTFFSDILTGIVNFAKNSWSSMQSGTTSTFNSIKSTISSIWNGIKTFFTTTLTGIVSDVRNKFSDMINAVRDKMNQVKGFVQNGWNAAVNVLKNINLKQLGKDAIQGFINGITSMVKNVAAAAKSAADAVTGKIRSILKIGSPSRLLKDMGQDTGTGYELGLLDKIRSIKTAATKMAKAALVPDFDVAGQVNQANRMAQTQLDSTLKTEMNVGRQPIVVNVYDNKEAVRAYVNENNMDDVAIRRFSYGH